MSQDRQIEYYPIDQIVGASRNPKNHNIRGIEVSIGAHGFVDPLLLDGRTGRLVGGHGRLETLQRMKAAGENPPEGIMLQDGEWCVPVVTGWSSRSDAEAERVLVGLNQYTIAGGWDQVALSELLSDLSKSTEGLLGTGYDTDSLDSLLRVLAASGQTPTDPSAEWAGMPEYTNTNKDPITVLIRFPSEADAIAFFAMIDRPRAKEMWYPHHDGLVVGDTSKEWVSAEVAS